VFFLTSIKVLSHASLLVKTSEASIVIDPWLLGSAYWRSWWNYPRAQYEVDELVDVDAVLISHIHWDHWHGPTLKRLLKDKPIIVGDDANPRSRADLQQIGFHNVTVAKHGRSVQIGDIQVYFYNFGLLLNDSAIVVQTSDMKLLNANDAKLAGSSLRHVTKLHGPFDFALRSHSSANSRICYSVSGDDSVVVDDRDHYLRSFKLFMDAVRPRYAIPFASNHCHLHPEVFDLNSYVSKPNELAAYLESSGTTADWKFVNMLPGSSWSTETGFLLDNQNAFESYYDRLSEYARDVRDRLEHYEVRELNVEIGDRHIQFFSQMASRCKVGRLDGVRFLLTKPSGPYKSFIFDGQAVFETRDFSPEPKVKLPLITMPAVIFRDAILKNMFHHAAISKRCRYMVATEKELLALQRFVLGLEKLELIGDGGITYWRRLCWRHLSRWRDLLVFSLAAYYRIATKRPFYLIEELILKNHSGIK
jgi:UDP-MurNAc hydroxylase